MGGARGHGGVTSLHGNTKNTSMYENFPIENLTETGDGALYMQDNNKVTHVIR